MKDEALVKVLYSAGPLPSHASSTFSGILSPGCIRHDYQLRLMNRGHAPACASAPASSLCPLLVTTACVVRDELVLLESLPLLYSDSCQSNVVGGVARLGGIARFGSAGVTKSHYSRSRCLLSDA